MTATSARAALGKSPSFGCWVGLPTLLSAEIIGQAGYDFVLIDREHGPADGETAQAQLIALKAAGAPGLIRVPQAEGPWIKQALDIGAAGVMVPAIGSAEAAARAVAEARYGPQGRRGAATGVVRASEFGADAGYLRRWNDEAFVIAQIEDPGALAQAEAIAAVDGVDALFFGPNDFAAAAGFPGDAAVLDAFEAMTAAARKAGKRVGMLPYASLSARDLVKKGVDLVTVAYDVALLRMAAEQALAAARG